MAEDEDLRARLLCGDLRALEAAYDLHAPSVYGVAVRVTGSAATAEVITEEVFAALWERPGSYDPRHGTLRAWLVTRSLHESALRSAVS
ncbi:sigma factor [Nonomuraea endophytica]|uniref:sigma factor n=1 Tax=Nonomuraea endophytica TaxID=714136 RepID=UPI0037CB5C2E